MANLILLSVLIGLVAIPIFASRARTAKRGLQLTMMGIIILGLFYLFAVRFIYPRFL